MTTYIAQRLLSAIPTLFGVIVISFALLYLLPGDPVQLLIGGATGITPEQVAELRADYGLDDPLVVQFLDYVWAVLHGDLGRSILTNRPVSELIIDAIPSTLELAFTALFISAVLGVTLGAISAIRRGTWIDHFCISFSLLAVSIPEFALAMLAVLVFTVELQWFPTFGDEGFSALVLPATVLGIRSAATIARVTRSSLLEVLGKQYVTTARAKGLNEVTVVGLHALKNALIPVVTLLGLQLGHLLAGAIVVETIFARPGLGSLLIGSVINKDLPVLRGTILVVAAGYVLVNLLVDLSYGWLDPRIRYDRSAARG